MRLDVWLDVSCLFKTRSAAQKACTGGKVEVNGVRAKPHRDVRVGDDLTITRTLGRRQRVLVRALAERHLPKPEARLLYEDVTPAPSPEEIEIRRMDRLAQAWRAASAGAPDKRERRMLRKMRGKTR
jgi:ribosome-associated heat shock protein Hsp15